MRGGVLAAASPSSQGDTVQQVISTAVTCKGCLFMQVLVDQHLRGVLAFSSCSPTLEAEFALDGHAVVVCFPGRQIRHDVSWD